MLADCPGHIVGVREVPMVYCETNCTTCTTFSKKSHVRVAGDAEGRKSGNVRNAGSIDTLKPQLCHYSRRRLRLDTFHGYARLDSIPVAPEGEGIHGSRRKHVDIRRNPRVALAIGWHAQRWIGPRVDVARQVTLESAVKGVLIVQPVIHSDRPDIRAELVVGIGMDPTEVVHQSGTVRPRNVALLKRRCDTAEALRRNLIVGERNVGERVDDNDRRAGGKQFREVSGSHLVSRRACKIEGLSRDPLAVPQAIEERLVFEDRSGGAEVHGMVEDLGLLILEEVSGA